MYAIKITDGGDLDDFNRFLGLAADVLGDFTPIWQESVHPYILRFVEKQFDTHGEHGRGGKWADYSSEERYAAMKQSIFDELPGSPDAEDWLMRWRPASKERLYPSLVDEGHSDHVFRFSDTSVEIGTSVPYAKDLTRRTVGPKGEPSPPRLIFALTKDQKEAMVTAIQRDIRDIFGADSLREARAEFQKKYGGVGGLF